MPELVHVNGNTHTSWVDVHLFSLSLRKVTFPHNMAITQLSSVQPSPPPVVDHKAEALSGIDHAKDNDCPVKLNDSCCLD